MTTRETRRGTRYEITAGRNFGIWDRRPMIRLKVGQVGCELKKCESMWWAFFDLLQNLVHVFTRP